MLAALAAASFATLTPGSASAEAMLLIEADSGKVLHAENATYPWYPASVTKVLTTYVALSAVRNRRLTLDTQITVSARAAAQAPSKIGFKPGSTVTLDNLLKMLMVKSANDSAYVIAEGVSGSVEKFADEMNATSKRLGMTQSSWVNPNGLPAEGQISSARDLAILARAFIKDFPEYHSYWNIPAIKLGKRVMRNTNSLIGRYQGADGGKTGFICASGFNVVASATRNGRRLIAVVLGAQSSPLRGAKTAGMLERGFNKNNLSWLTPSLGTVDQLQPIDAAPPDMREEMCGKHRKRPAAEEADDDVVAYSGNGNSGEIGSATAFMLSNLAPSTGGLKPSQLIAPPGPVNPIVVHTGPAKVSADSKVAAVRTKLDAKSGKNPKGAPTNQVASADPSAAVVPATQAPATSGTISAAPPGAFGPPPGTFSQPKQGSNSSFMSFAPAARAEPAPLTAMPAQTVTMPMPRPKPKTTTAAVAPAAPKPR